MTRRASQVVASLVIVTTVILFAGGIASAVSPTVIEQGRQLFERDWPMGNPSIGSDGLGPLFNARSCVACHHQGGVGGGGDSRFNAKTLGIEELKIVGGTIDDTVVAKMVSTFHPGFVTAGGTITNTLPIAHHGGSPQFIAARKAMLANVPAVFSEFGGPENAEETRRSYATPILFSNQMGPHQMTLKARLFHRNTTSLFGSGLIDMVSDSEIAAQARAQKSHPEISGRPSILDTGDYGKFGWRGNVRSLLAFNDQACANEVGLETKRKPQPLDPMNPAYRNPTIDIQDNQIRTLTAFVAALPAPVRAVPEDSDLRAQAERGEYLFASLGCAVCHVPNMGPAKGLYSDLLLHDMGYESIDLNHAEPYRVSATPERFVSTTTTTNSTTNTNTTGYYGGSSTMSTQSTRRSGSTGDEFRRGPRVGRSFTFVAPTIPPPFKVIDLGSRTEDLGEEVSTSETEIDRQFRRGRQTGTATTTTRQSTQRTIRDVIRVRYEPTNFNQEWRTPPLWGVRDSAPYLHDGRAETLLEAITMHEGEGAGTRDRFLNLSLADRHAIIAFLETLVAPPDVPQPRL